MSLPPLGALPLQIELTVFGALCFFLIAWLIIFILVAVWVYRDAESRGMSGALWLIVVILLGLIGLIVYLIVRSDHPVGGYRAPAGMPYPAYPPPPQPPAPPQAGGVAPAAAGTCRNCGSSLNPGAAFCPRCGARV